MQLRTLAATLCIAVLVGSAFAQAGSGQQRQVRDRIAFQGGAAGRMGMSAMLLERADVQRELNLTEQQKTQIRQMLEEQRRARAELRNLPPEQRLEKMLELRQKYDPTSVLTDAQKKRLRELELQAMGPMAFLNPEVADELKLTQEQRSRLMGIMNEFRNQLREQWQGGGFQQGNQGQRMQQMQRMREQMEQRMLEVLTPAQRQQWQQMQGKPFQFEGGRPMLWGNWGGGDGAPRRGGGGFGGGRGFGN